MAQKYKNPLLKYVLVVLACNMTLSLYPVINTLDDLRRKNPDYNHYNLILNGNPHENVEVHPDFHDSKDIFKYINILHKAGIHSDQEILKHLKLGYQDSLSALFDTKHRLQTKNNNRPLYFALATCGIILCSYLMYKVVQYYRNKQEQDALSREELRHQATAQSALNSAAKQSPASSIK